jgi:hypothetical protein
VARPLASFLAGALAVGAASCAPPARPPPVRHVFVLMLENQAYEATFGANSAAPYLARTLVARGALLTQYYAIGHASLGNYVALISGQAANEATQLDCPRYEEFRPSSAVLDRHGQLPGHGCIYPTTVPTLPDQLETAGLTWKAYLQDMGKDPGRESGTCGHVPVGALETTSVATPLDQYAAKHNPFVYFHSIIDDTARCHAHVVNLEQLRQDLASAATTANYNFIVPNLCDDGHDAPCADGRPGGLPAIDAFLTQWVPLIEGSAAFQADGMLVITFDESDRAGDAGAAACCGELPLPGAKFQPGFGGPGGGRIGAVVLSRFVKSGTVSQLSYNHYALLRTVEAIFTLPPLGYADLPQVQVFGADVFSASAPRASAR